MDRRDRCTRDTTDAIDVNSNPSPAIQTTAVKIGASDGMPAGFCGVTPSVTSIAPGRNIDASIRTARHPSSVGGSHRHLGDATCPVGKRARIIGTAPIVMNSQLFNQAAQIPKGSSPGCVARAYFDHSVDAPPSSSPEPLATKSHPMGFSGRRDTRTPPSAM